MSLPSVWSVLQPLKPPHIFRQEVVITCYSLSNIELYGVSTDWLILKNRNHKFYFIIIFGFDIQQCLRANTEI